MYTSLCISVTDDIISDVLVLVIMILDLGLRDISHVMFNALSWIISPDVDVTKEMISGASVNV